MQATETDAMGTSFFFLGHHRETSPTYHSLAGAGLMSIMISIWNVEQGPATDGKSICQRKQVRGNQGHRFSSTTLLGKPAS